jgi:hypothetical protein
MNNIKITMSSNFWRQFYIVSFDHEVKKYHALFYKSSGSATPGLKNRGEVFPILGIKGEGKLGEALASTIPNGNEIGWIWKNITSDGGKARENLSSYFGMEVLKRISIQLEDNPKPDIVLKWGEFMTICDYLHEEEGEQFFPNAVLTTYGYSIKKDNL